MCRIYGLKPICLIADKNLLTNPNAGGQYNFITHNIIIDPTELHGSDGLKILFHEFRHYWQDIYHHKIFKWWTCYSQGLYKQLYNHPFCSIEEDVRVFGDSMGKFNSTNLLELYTKEELDYLKNNPYALSLAIEYVDLLIPRRSV